MPTEFRAAVDVRLLSADSCAGIWFRFRPFRGYLVRVCENTVYVGHPQDRGRGHHHPKTFPLDQPIAVGAPPTEIGLRRGGRPVRDRPGRHGDRARCR